MVFRRFGVGSFRSLNTVVAVLSGGVHKLAYPSQWRPNFMQFPHLPQFFSPYFNHNNISNHYSLGLPLVTLLPPLLTCHTS